MSESIHKSERKPQAMHHCCVCLRDITGMRRVKDPKGRYFCKRCYKVGQLRKHMLAKRRLSAAPVIASASDLRLTVASLDPALVTVQIPAPTLPTSSFVIAPLTTMPPPAAPLAPAPGPAKTAPAPVTVTASASIVAPAENLSARCPLCNEPLLPNQRVCSDCAAELPSLNNLLSVRHEHTLRQDRHQRRLKNLKTAALVAIPLAIASLALLAYGQRHPTRPSAAPEFELPTSRARAVQEFLSCIQNGSDASCDTALRLIAAHSAEPANAARDDAFRSAFKLMHEDFAKKYGPDWLAEAHVQNLFPEDDTQFVPFAITLHNDVYHITSQALTFAGAPSDPTTPQAIHFPEDGKQPFAIFQIEEYAVVHDATVERRDPLKLTDSPTPADFKSQANNFPAEPPNSQ